MIGHAMPPASRCVGPAASRLTVSAVACVILAVCGSSCRKAGDDPAVVTSTSAAKLDEGRRLLAAGDFAAARDAFAAAAGGGGLQPDFYCEARLQEAHCAARLGDYDAAEALLDDLAAGAPDLDRIEKVRALITSRRASDPKPQTPPAADPAEPSAAP